MPLFLLCALLAVDFHELHWRSIGPYRGGRTKAAAQVPGRSGTFLIGAVNGGVWKTDDFGRTWSPLFDDQPTGSIGAIAVASSSPETIYVGSGEGMHRPDLSVGDGLYKSTDGGKSFRHLGLRDVQQIAQIAVDPSNPNRLFVAALGHPYGPNQERGLFRSLDGGETMEKVLSAGEAGAADVVLDPSDPRIVYAALWEAREGPWENGSFDGEGSGLYKSLDGGDTWKKLSNGLPDYAHEGLGRIGLGLAPSRPQRLYATVGAQKNAGLYRSDDGGENWTLINADERLSERNDDAAEVKVHPQDPDTVFVASVVTWKSTDGGKSFSAFRGAPGGDDYQRIVIDPRAPETMLIASDQGAIITVNGGRTFSSWYNQPTAQMFHVTADDAFPYRLCGGQQESGSACVPSRGSDGAITFREWHPAGFEEYGYGVPDPKDPEVIIGGKLQRWNRRTGQTQEIAPVAGKRPGYRVVRTQPVVYSPLDRSTLYFASNTLWRSQDGGQRWTQISPDLSRKIWELPESIKSYAARDEAKPKQRGVIYSLAPSPKAAGLIWAGTDDGLIHLTRDGGKSWREVTPPQLVPWAKVSILEAGHFDAQTAYAAINTLRLDILKPQILRTHDGGKHWDSITLGLPASGTVVNVVREDPLRKGLLYAGTEQGVFVSFDDGGHWESLRLNMPATSIRDLIVKGGDLAIATHGRGFWILDDIEPLREPAPAESHLFKPQLALRVRWNTNSDTPLPPDEPMGTNPPDGAIVDYFLDAQAEVTLEIFNAQNKLVRRFASTDPERPLADEGNVPRWWIRPERPPSGAPGLHRFVWDLHETPPARLKEVFPIAAIPGNTPREPRGPWAMPGSYLVRLTSNGRSSEQPLQIKLDPRVKVTRAALQAEHALAEKLVKGLEEDVGALAAIRAAREKVKGTEQEKPLAALEGEGRVPRSRQGQEAPTLTGCGTRLAELLGQIEQVDAAPTAAQTKAAELLLKESEALVAKWKVFSQR